MSSISSGTRNYHLDPSRSAKVSVEILKGYRGVVMADGYPRLQATTRCRISCVLRCCQGRFRGKFGSSKLALHSPRLDLVLAKGVSEAQHGKRPSGRHTKRSFVARVPDGAVASRHRNG